MQTFMDVLPDHLAERAVPMTPLRESNDGEFVLYWAHHALRAHQNAALEAAASLALHLDKPLLVYQGLGGRHRYNSDRHHHFILQSARDFDHELRELGHRLHFHLPADPLAGGPLNGLMENACAVVSELYPVPPFPGWYAGHRERHPDLPWLLVDASLVLPMPLLQKCPTRAFQFRRSHEAEIHRRVMRDWPEPERWPQSFEVSPGFEPFDLSSDLEQAVANCRIDHSIPPVSATPGGTRAGYRRWTDFRDNGLDRYHRLRNDAALPNAVSRMSAYLHYGCVSAIRIAREAMERGGEGASKFLDELLIWRELSHHFCYHVPQLESLDSLPEWARDSLLEHEADPREETFDWETLSRGQTGTTLWDLGQQSLLRHGELHNNLRMTWGKGFLPWTQRVNRAQKLMIDLNHRYALDGNDPNSYGGLLWCLGQFDRAFPPGPIFGKVRQRSLKRHQQRLDMGRYSEWVSRPAGNRRLRVAVIGAGLCGLTAARTLTDQGHEVTVLEKARGPGGRMSTRRQDGYRFDHGAQYFTARDPRFLRHVLAWQERGLVEPWSGRIGAVEDGRVRPVDTALKRYVAVPSMNAICRDLAAGLPDCRFGWQVNSAGPDGEVWRITSESGDSLEADALVMTAPAPQAARLLPDIDLGRHAGEVEMAPCWALMAVLDRPLLEDWDGAFVNSGPLSWISRQASLPGRPDDEAWVLHANPDWSQNMLEQDPAEITRQLLDAAGQLPGASPFNVTWTTAHRWRYALAREALSIQTLWFEHPRLAVAGAWCHGSRVEGAFLSGVAAAGRVLGSIA